jgi:hypothetical protein
MIRYTKAGMKGLACTQTVFKMQKKKKNIKKNLKQKCL